MNFGIIVFELTEDLVELYANSAMRLKMRMAKTDRNGMELVPPGA